jgi:hypothetical protein
MPAPKLYAVFVTGPIIPKKTPAAKANTIPKIFIIYKFFFD